MRAKYFSIILYIMYCMYIGIGRRDILMMYVEYCRKSLWGKRVESIFERKKKIGKYILNI